MVRMDMWVVDESNPREERLVGHPNRRTRLAITPEELAVFDDTIPHSYPEWVGYYFAKYGDNSTRTRDDQIAACHEFGKRKLEEGLLTDDPFTEELLICYDGGRCLGFNVPPDAPHVIYLGKRRPTRSHIIYVHESVADIYPSICQTPDYDIDSRIDNDTMCLLKSYNFDGVKRVVGCYQDTVAEMVKLGEDVRKNRMLQSVDEVKIVATDDWDALMSRLFKNSKVGFLNAPRAKRKKSGGGFGKSTKRQGRNRTTKE